ncbi:MAG: hypothetical protein HYT89_06895 [Candidatus Omnitrophica bacterium]|nr:hypothetical protein [Candidatus Omnitrophota bacterium]
MISITLVVIITGSIYYCMNSALESWSYSRDQLSLQKVLAETIDKVINGSFKRYGLKDTLEIVSAGNREVEFVPPWVDNTHTAGPLNFIYTLNKKIKPGSPIPLGQYRPTDKDPWQFLPLARVDLENDLSSQLQLKLAVQEGSLLRFIYHPDYESSPDVAEKIYWDETDRQVYFDDGEGNLESLSKNLFGVEIERMELRYYTNSNQLVTDRRWVDVADLPILTGVEVMIEAKLNDHKQTLVTFVTLRNAPARTGYLSLRRDMRLRIPDSEHVKTLMITSLTGITNNDKLQLEAVPASGEIWRLTVDFEKPAGAKPVIKMLTVEYPPQQTVYTEYPRSDADLGINLNLIGNDGRYDYDDDGDVDDAVLLEGDVDLVVTQMNIKGAGIFVRP